MNSFPFTSDGDRKVKTSDFRELFKKYFTNGVFNGTFNVVQSTGMKVVLKKGWCNIEGCFGWTDEDIELTIESVAQETTHNIVLRLDDNREVRKINAYVVKGNPNAVAPTRTQTVYELVVARIKTNATTTSIQQSMIEDTRLNSSLCGIVSSTVENIDTTTFYEQIQGDLQEFKDNEQAEFLEWFETIKDQLSTDVAGNLQNQIDQKSKIVDGQGQLLLEAPMTPNDNLLTNSDFRSGIINQKGETTYDFSSQSNGKFTIDMWKITKMKLIVKSTEGTIRIENSDTTSHSISHNDFDKPLINTHTFYANVKNVSEGCYMWFYNRETGATYEQSENLVSGDNVWTWSPSQPADVIVNFGISIPAGGYIELYQCKLEKGSHFTGMPIWNKALELSICEKRFKRMRIRKNFWVVKAFSQNGTWEENFPVGSFLKDPSVTYTPTSTNNVNITTVQSSKTGVLRIRFVPQSIEAMQYIEIDVTMDAYNYQGGSETMNNDIIIYAKRDENNSIIRIVSSCILDDTEGYEEIDRWVEGEDRYLYAHADNGEYVKEKHGKPLYDENGIPNYHGDFVKWTEEKKETNYPLPTQQPSEQDQFNAMILKEIALLKVGV